LKKTCDETKPFWGSKPIKNKKGDGTKPFGTFRKEWVPSGAKNMTEQSHFGKSESQKIKKALVVGRQIC